MKEYLFPVEYKRGKPWDTQMIGLWVDSGLPYLTFAFNRFFPHSLSHETFWLYLYYTKSSSEDRQFQGKLRYRFQVIDWAEVPFDRLDTHLFPSELDAKIWFWCNRFEEVTNIFGNMLAYEDFRHSEGKNLASCLRSSIAPVICAIKPLVKRHYP